jgi:hypothetical protein
VSGRLVTPSCVPSALRGAIPSCPMRRPRVAIWVPFAPIESEPHGLGRAPVRPARVTAGPALPRAGIQQNWGSRSSCAFRPGRPDQSERFGETARPGIAVAATKRTATATAATAEAC